MHFVVVGGGVAGVACVEELARVAAPGDVVTLVSASRSVKGVAHYTRVSDALERFDLTELPLESLPCGRAHVRVVHASVGAVDARGGALRP